MQAVPFSELSHTEQIRIYDKHLETRRQERLEALERVYSEIGIGVVCLARLLQRANDLIGDGREDSAAKQFNERVNELLGTRGVPTQDFPKDQNPAKKGDPRSTAPSSDQPDRTP